MSVAYTERLAEISARPSIGTIGDSFGNSLAETLNGLYKTELIRRQGPWRNVEHVELATLAWVEWFNNHRLHGELGDIPPRRVRAQLLRSNQSYQQGTTTHPDLMKKPGRITATSAGSATTCTPHSPQRAANTGGGLTQRTRPHARPRRSPETWTATELTKFLGTAGGHRLHPALHLTATTGMSRGEIAGLRGARRGH